MKKPTTLLLAGVVVLFTYLILDKSQTSDSLKVVWGQDSPGEYAKYFNDIRTAEGEDGPTYGPGYRFASFQQMKAAAKSGQAPIPWVERGPGNVGGRTRAIIVDKADVTRSTWVVGAVGGGIWRTTNKGLNWTPMTDHLPRLAIGSLAQALSKPSVMYAGTGEGYRNADAAIGDGIFKSTDGGLTWTPLPSTLASYDFLFVNRLIVSPTDENLVLAATNSGLFRSTNGGASWTNVKAAAGTAGFYQIVYQPGNFSIQYAAEIRRGIWKSTDAGVTWATANSGLVEALSGVRIEIDVSPVNTNRLVALVEVAEGPDLIYFSNDGAANWTPFTQTGATVLTDVAGTQGWYDLMVKAHPFNADVVFLGGIGLYRSTITKTTNSSVFTDKQNNTGSFLSFVNFGGGQLGGGLRLGTDEPESTITPDKMVPVEVRFGPGKRQMAHRFVPPDQSGVSLSTYPYMDYVEIPFEVWDTQNNRQLMVSFRDRNNNGRFDLIEYDAENVGREYVFIHAIPYDAEGPSSSIAITGGVRIQMAYFFWPILTAGASWNPASLPASTLQFYWVNVPFYSGTITSTGGGVHADQHMMVVTPTTGTNFEVVLGNDGGVYYSGDGGSNWIDRIRGYNTSQFFGIDKKLESNAYIGGTQDNGSWRSTVNPSSSQFWFSQSGGDGFEAVWHKQNDQKLIVTSQWNWIERSVNGGQSFTDGRSGLTDISSAENGAQFLTVMESDPVNSEILFTVGRSGVWRSQNFASSWTLTPIAPEHWGIRTDDSPRAKIRISKKLSSIVWAGSEMDAVPGGTGGDLDGKLHVSTNGGLSFTRVPTPSISPGRISGLATSFEFAETVYVLFGASNRAKIIRSTDLGQTWVDLSGFDPGPSGLVSQNGFPDVVVYDVLDFPNSTRLWAATEIGIIESINDGATWRIAENGLPAVSVWQLRLLDGQIVAATHGRGIWSVPSSSLPTVNEIVTAVSEAEQPFETSLGSIFPNPVLNSARLTWSAGLPGTARIQVFDVQGRIVDTLFEGVVDAGPQETSLSGQNLAAGAYFIRIEIGGTVLTKPFMRVR